MHDDAQRDDARLRGRLRGDAGDERAVAVVVRVCGAAGEVDAGDDAGGRRVDAGVDDCDRAGRGAGSEACSRNRLANSGLPIPSVRLAAMMIVPPCLTIGSAPVIPFTAW